MDEILFRLSHQIETLQIQTSILMQHGKEWIIALGYQAQNLLYELSDSENYPQLANIIEKILNFLQKSWDQILHQYYSIHFNTRGLYYQAINVYSNEVSRREALFCLGGITIGTLFGYYLGINWKSYIHHMHRIKAVVCHRYIGIEGVSSDDIEMPTIRKSDELLIRVKAASVNLVDTKICNGYSKMYRKLLNSGIQKDLPVVLGRECAGVVADIGQNVINFDIGDKVFLAVPSWAPGTMAEYIVVPEHQVAKGPKNCTFEAAASIPYNGCIAWDALVNQSIIEEGNAKGKRILIYGGVSPIGCMLTQLAKLWGGYVVTVCKRHAVSVSKALGADDVIVLGESDLEKELHLHDRFDAVFYTGGLPADERLLRKHLTSYGSYVSTVPEYLLSDKLGFLTGSIFATYVKMKWLLQYIFGFNVYHWKDGSKIKTSYLEALHEVVSSERFHIVLDRVYAPYKIEQALQHVLDPDAIGSTVITFQ